MNYFTAAFVVSWIIYFAYLFFLDRKLMQIENRTGRK